LALEALDFALAGNFSTFYATNDIIGRLYFVPFLTVLVFGPTILLLVSKRSGDTTLKRHLKWFGLFVLGIFLSIASVVIFQGWNYTFGPFVFSFALYKSAKSLVPLNRISLKS